MSKTKFVNNMTRKIHKIGFTLKKHSPEILVAAGVTGTVVSTVMACKATTKAGAILEETKQQMEQINEVAETVDASKYSEEDKRKDTAIVYTQTALKFVKLYGPSVAVGALSISAILFGHKILKKRNIALAAAYKAVDTGFKQYRGRVIEALGEDIDKEFKYGVKAKEVEKKVVDEKGKEKTVKETVNVVDPNNISEFAVIFDCGNDGWDKDPQISKYFLLQQQNYANDMLKSRGYLFLNEVYEMLGFQKTKAGQVVGWTYDEKNPNGDNFVDFGIFDMTNPATVNFVNGYERSILLDFNVDGNILEYMA